MSVGLSLARVLVLVGGVCLVLFGFYLIAIPDGPGTIIGFWTVLGGVALMVGALIERIRYRSDAQDRERAPAGAAGGEPPGTRLEPRFRRTDEIFTDPTSGHLMRVWMDPSTGERRYLSEG
jgi:hypothetical protein